MHREKPEMGLAPRTREKNGGSINWSFIKVLKERRLQINTLE
jgi:hypothetical protein